MYLDVVEFAQLDRDTHKPLTEAGVALLVLDNTGHGQTRGRGASAKRDKTDVELIFKAKTGHRFKITHTKNRYGPLEKPPGPLGRCPDGTEIPAEGCRGRGENLSLDACVHVVERPR